MYPPYHPAYQPYGYYQPPPFVPTREGTAGEALRHSFDAYGMRMEEEEPRNDFEQGRRSDATRFFYTQ